MMDRGTVRNIWSFNPKKIEKLVHLVGFIIRTYHDARSPEGQNTTVTINLGALIQLVHDRPGGVLKRVKFRN